LMSFLLDFCFLDFLSALTQDERKLRH
jgi:hypothetical protein